MAGENLPRSCWPVRSCWSRQGWSKRKINLVIAIAAVFLLVFNLLQPRLWEEASSCEPSPDMDLDTVDWSKPLRNISTQALALRNFVEKYRHPYKESTEEEFLKLLRRLIGEERLNKRPNTHVLEFRESLRAALGKAGHVDNFLLTETNVPEDGKICFYARGEIQDIPAVLMKNLPKDTGFKPGQLRSCSMVGSSGILRGSGCGKEIDKSQSVFRFNLAPVKGFETDVGNRTDYTTMNPSVVFKLNGLKKQADRSKFGALLEQFRGSHLWLPAFAVSEYLPIVGRAKQFSGDSQIVRPVLGHPEHFLTVSSVWQAITRNKAMRPSTGLYFILSLIDVCDQINVYGYWPYETTMDGRRIPYHYHNNAPYKTEVHIFDSEFKTLVYMHSLNVINLQLNPCSQETLS